MGTGKVRLVTNKFNIGRKGFLMKRLLPFIILLATLFAGCSQKQEINLLLITGGHGFEREQFFSMFDSFKNVVHTEAVHPNANRFYAEELAKDIDVFCFYDMNQDITEEEKNNLLKMVESGKGLLFMHHSLANYQEWDEFLNVIGGRYFMDTTIVNGVEIPKSTYEHDVKMDIQVAAKHPVTKGLNDFTIHDEVYGGYYVSADVTPLLTTTNPVSNKNVVWANKIGNSRIVTIQLGHDHFAYEDENFRKLLANSIKWVGDY
jgi:uncharacterized protein